MKREILAEVTQGQTRLAVIEDGRLAELSVERESRERLAGNIYLGKVVNVLPGMQAAFVDIGLDKNAYLSVSDVPTDGLDVSDDVLTRQLSSVSIKKLLKPGQDILVQVTKDPNGAKGPRVSCHATLPGRYSVILPTVEYIGVSRKLASQTERTRLRELAEKVKPTGVGMIVRTAAEGIGEDELRRDAEHIMYVWERIEAKSRHIKAPAILHRDLSVIYRAVRDIMTNNDASMLIDDRRQWEMARETAVMCGLDESLISFYEGDTPLFDAHEVDSQFEKALARRVWLKSGGYLVFDYAEALTVIDVNTGKYVGRDSFEETVFRINCEASEEIARQLRLRDIGGIIIIDFIDMEDETHRDELINRLRSVLGLDRAKTNLAGITSLGLVEMTRKRVYQPLHQALMRQCEECGGLGYVRSAETTARSALMEINRRARAGMDAPQIIEAASDVADELYAIGTDAPRVYAHANPGMSAGEFEIFPAVENALPAKTRPITRGR